MRNPIEILSLEDDPLQAEWIRQTIESGVAGSKVNHVGTESEFVARFPGIVAAPPTLILMDVMLRWADPSPNIPRSEEHTSELQSLRHLVCRLLLEKKKN